MEKNSSLSHPFPGFYRIVIAFLILAISVQAANVHRHGHIHGIAEHRSSTASALRVTETHIVESDVVGIAPRSTSFAQEVLSVLEQIQQDIAAIEDIIKLATDPFPSFSFAAHPASQSASIQTVREDGFGGMPTPSSLELPPSPSTCGMDTPQVTHSLSGARESSGTAIVSQKLAPGVYVRTTPIMHGMFTAPVKASLIASKFSDFAIGKATTVAAAQDTNVPHKLEANSRNSNGGMTASVSTASIPAPSAIYKSLPKVTSLTYFATTPTQVSVLAGTDIAPNEVNAGEGKDNFIYRTFTSAFQSTKIGISTMTDSQPGIGNSFSQATSQIVHSSHVQVRYAPTASMSTLIAKPSVMTTMVTITSAMMNVYLPEIQQPASTFSPPLSSLVPRSYMDGAYFASLELSTSLQLPSVIPSISVPLGLPMSSIAGRAAPTARAVTIGGGRDVVVYYGQSPLTTAFGLSQLCSNPYITIINLAFVSSFFGPNGWPSIQFGPGCSGPNAAQAKYMAGLQDCSTLGTQIAACQAAGKKVLVSLGGAAASSQTLESLADATRLAQTLWALFGGGSASTALLPDDQDTSLRPFGPDVTVDGFDIDNEDDSTTYWTTFATELRSLYLTDTSKQYYLSSAPQCPRPDASIPVEVMNMCDWVNVQFYNNPSCEVSNPSGFLQSLVAWSGQLASSSGTSAKRAYIPNRSSNSSSSSSSSISPQLMIGLAGWPAGAGSGYISPSELSTLLLSSSSATSSSSNGTVSLQRRALLGSSMSGMGNIGGLMLWDGPEALANVDENGLCFVDAVGQMLAAAAS